MTWPFAIVVLITYVAYCKTQRHRQQRTIEATYHRRRGHSLSSMTFEDAWEIQTWLAEQEFPKTLSTAVFFALFKTYGIPSIAKVLTATGHMTNSLFSLSRRTADTGQLLNNVIIAHPKSKRSIDAMVRTAWMHRGFRQSGKITNEQMLYTLSLFALEGKRWVEQYEWRPLSDLEICAVGTFWQQIGHDLEISFSELDISPNANGLEWHRSLERWSVAYEREHMVSHPCNHTLAVATLNLLGAGLPSLANDFAGAVFRHLMGPELRRAMSMPAPPLLTALLVNGLLRARKFFLRHLALPRSHGSRKRYIESSASAMAADQYHALRYRAFPWYIKTTTLSKFQTWLKGQPQPGPSFYDQGYRILDLGPEEVRGKGQRAMSEMSVAIRVARGVE